MFFINLHASGQFVKTYLVDDRGYEVDSTNAKYKRSVFWNRFKQLSFEDHGLADGKIYQSGGIMADTLVREFANAENIRFYPDGKCTHFFPNGRKKLSGTYQKGLPSGVFQAWYESGQIKGVYLFEIFEGQQPPYDHEFRVVAFFDENGRQLASDGTGRYYEKTDNSEGEGRVVFGMKNGHWKGTFNVEDKTYFYEEFYRNGSLERGSSKAEDGIIRRYKKLNTIPKFKDGTRTFYSFISRHLRYPQSARRARIQGEVYVMFTVDEKGNTTHVKIAKGLQEDCDAQAIRAVNKANHFSPATYRGRKVKYRMIIPISFSTSGF